MGNLGERLQQARLRAGLSLREISARTKIREVLLDAIEREDFGRLPAGLLARGLLRAYAREVGLDPESVVRQFMDEFEPEPAPPEPAPPMPAGGFTQAQGSDSGRGWRRRFLAAAGVAALTAVVFVYLNRRAEIGDSARSDPIATDGNPGASAGQVGQEAQNAGQEPPVNAVIAAVNPSEVEPLTVATDPTGIVWVEATADGMPVLYRLWNPASVG